MMKKRFFSWFLALALVITTFFVTTPEAYASGVDITLKVHETKTLPCLEGFDHKWSAGNKSILDVDGNGSFCKITAKSTGTTTVRVDYVYYAASPDPTVIEKDRIPDWKEWTVKVEKDSSSSGGSSSTPSSGGSSSSTVPATLVEPSVKRGVVGEDVSKYITRISVNGYNKNTGLLAAEFDGLWGFVDKDFKLVIPFQFASCYSGGQGKYIEVAVDNDKRNWFLIDNTGKYLMREGYPSYEFYGDYFRAFREGRSWYYKIENGTAKKITENAFEEGIKGYEAPDEGSLYLQWASDGNWYFSRAGHLVGTGEDWALVIKKPEGVENGPNNKDLNRFICEGVMVVTKDGKSGAIDQSGKVVIPFIYDELCNSSGGYMAYKKDGYFGMLKNPVNPPAPTPAPTPTPSASEFTIEDGVLSKYNGKGGVVTIPGTVTSIREDAFFDCTGLTGVVIPSSVTSIGSWAFFSCENLISVTIPASVTSIGNFAFDDCTKLRDIHFGGNEVQWKAISIGAFNDPLKTAAIHYAGGVAPSDMEIEDGQLKKYTGKGGNVVIPNGVTSITSSAFDMTMIKTSLTMNLTSVTIPNSVTNIGSYAFYGCKDLTSLTIPNSVEKIGNGAFSKCRGLTSITIPNSVTSVGELAFTGCIGLTSATLSNRLTDIEGWMFYGCTNLTSVTIPASVTNIKVSAFQSCDALKDVYYGGTQAQWKAITVGIANDALQKATIHYNSISSAD